MRVDPETVYIELLPGSMSLNFETKELTPREAVRLNWKPDPRPGTKWAYRTFVGESLGEVLQNLGQYLADKGLDGLLTELEGKKGAA